MTARWAVEMAEGEALDPLRQAAHALVERFSEGATLPEEHPQLGELAATVARGAPIAQIQHQLSALSFEGYLRGAVVQLASSLSRHQRPDVALLLARELVDALDRELGLELAQAILALPAVEAQRTQRGSDWSAANELLAETLEDAGDPRGAVRHYEAVLSVDVDHGRSLRGWSRCVRELERRGLPTQHRSRGLALLDGLEELELSDGLGVERYELRRPLGRGRHAVVYEAFDRRVGRAVAIKRLLADVARADRVPGRVLEARFFTEARTLARVRSAHVVGLLDVQPKHRFIALELCRGGNLRLALRRGLVSGEDLPRIAQQLRLALDAVHAAGAVHRDVKPANILVREARPGSPIALADFGLAIRSGPDGSGPNAGTLRYLAPEIRAGGRATSHSDRFSAGVVLLELALAPAPLPREFDRIDGDFDAPALVTDSIPDPWNGRIRSLLSAHPESRTW
jgi:tRNA A-37 threonylcarbamoyl transferase component Bud32